MLDLKATLETRVSKKNNTEYKVLVIDLPYGLKKIVFLEEAELKLLELYKNDSDDLDLKMPDFR